VGLITDGWSFCVKTIHGVLVSAVFLAGVGAFGQQMPGMDMGPKKAPAQASQGSGQNGQSMGQMPEMEMGSMPGMQPPGSFVEKLEEHAGSGTGAEPAGTPVDMVMAKKGAWMVMFHASVFVLDTQQTSVRGGDKFFSTNWFMPMAQRKLGPGELTLQGMFSLEPATVTGEQYPLLFQQGETAYGLPIEDGQHPHNLVMGLGAYYDVKLGGRGLLSFYAAPVGDPAIGPVGYPHRASAAENPVAPLGHHQEDSTHVAYDVATVGAAYGMARVEVSGFHGREPSEHRWEMQQGAMDSWSVRGTVEPGKEWSGQYSYARIASPEVLFPAENQERMTASVTYDKALAKGNWATMALWGRTRDVGDPGSGSTKVNSYLLESTLRFAGKSAVWTRVENAGRTNELLVGEHAFSAGFVERPLTHVQAYTFGYDRDVMRVGHVDGAVGAQMTAYGVGKPLQGIYGSDPVGVNVFLRFKVR
jgi:hypothetical protein